MFIDLVSPSQFFNTILTPLEVANAAVLALWAGESRHIELPWVGKIMKMPIKGMPSFWSLAVQDAVGQSMQTFGDHKPMD
jgi:hypothetical protein